MNPVPNKSAKTYLERKHPDKVTLRRPGPRMSSRTNPVHTLPLTAPYPGPEYLQATQAQPPDSGRTGVWPWSS